MNLLGIEIKKPTKTDILPISLASLIGLLLINPLSAVLPPETMLSCFFAGITGAILASMGIQARQGMRHIVLITVFCLPMSMVGHIIGLLIAS